MFELVSPKKGHLERRGVIMYEDLSEETKKKVLEIKNIQDPREAHLEILPLAYTHISFSLETQEAIDEEVLLQLGYYQIAS